MATLESFQDLMFDPQWRTDGLERLDFLDWKEIDVAIQSALCKLDPLVAANCSGLQVISGNNHGKTRGFFSYRVYQAPKESAVDPVVVGIEVYTDETITHLRGDICGEVLGDILAQAGERTAVDEIDVIEAIRDLSETLCDRADVVADALRNMHRVVE